MLMILFACLRKKMASIFFSTILIVIIPALGLQLKLKTIVLCPFLDILVYKEGIHFSTGLFRKQTFTGLYTDFASLSPTRYKINLVRILVFCAFHICSSFVNFHKEIVKIKQIRLANGFPGSLIDKVIFSFLNLQYILHTKPKDKGEGKDCIPTLVCSNVVYKFSCSGCNATYYGKTNRNLLIHCNEHLAINRNGHEIVSSSPSSIRDHIKQTGHTMSIGDFHIISKSSNSYDLLIHESLLIQRDRPSLNSQQSSISLVLF